MKDIEPFSPMHFKLNPITLDEFDKQGTEVSTATLEPANGPPVFARNTPAKVDVILDKLVETISAKGLPIRDKASFKTHGGRPIAFTVDHKMILKSAFYNACKADIQITTHATKPNDSRKKSFNRHIKALKESGAIAESAAKYLIVSL